MIIKSDNKNRNNESYSNKSCDNENVDNALASQNNHKCYITKIRINKFRNLDEVDLILEHKPILIIGHNGAGKTNILEAISLFILNKGFRGADISEFTQHTKNNHNQHSLNHNSHFDSLSNQYINKKYQNYNLNNDKAPIKAVENQIMYNLNNWFISVDLKSDQGENQLFISKSIDKNRKIFKINGEQMRKKSNFNQYISLIWATPAMDSLFTGSKKIRRQFIDNIVQNYDSNHQEYLDNYEKSVKERFKLLTNAHYHNIAIDYQWLKILEKNIVTNGIAVAFARNKIINLMNYEGRNNMKFTNFIAKMEGKYENLCRSNIISFEIEEIFLNDLQNNRQKDVLSGRTEFGIHRSDFMVFNLDNQMPTSLCSTGEQKSVLLSLIIAQARVSKELKNMSSIVLLDEIVSHLDHKNIQILLNELIKLNCQCLITSTNKQYFQTILEQSQIIDIKEGRVI